MAAVAVTVAGLAGALAGCGSAAPLVAHQVAAHTTPESTVDPAMVMITLADLGYHASDIDVSLGEPVMFMVVNHGGRPHELRSAVPLASLQVVDIGAGARQSAALPAGTLDVSVPAGGEIDVTGVPTTTGRFALADGAVAAGAIVVAAPPD